MKRTLFYTSLAALCLVTISVWAQKAGKDKKPATKAAPAVVKEMTIYLGNSTLDSGRIAKPLFDSLMKQGLKVEGNNGTVSGFSFTYAERGIFEDSVGDPIERVELLTEYCKGDTLPHLIKNTLPNRTKNGDTAFFDRIIVRLPDGNETSGKPMKFIITK
jgi:hypothetical protein